MSTENIAEQFMEMVEKFMSLRPTAIPPEHVVQFRKKMAEIRGSDYQHGDYAFILRILMLLSQNAEPLTMSELSSQLDVPMSTATRIVDGLVRGRMIERVNDPNDRRVVRVGVSKKGREFYETGVKFGRQRITNLLKNFTAEEQVQLLNLMSKLFEALSKEKLQHG